MSDLRIHKEILHYFRHIGKKYSTSSTFDITSPISTRFDAFYLCLVIGLLYKVHKEDLPPAHETEEMLGRDFTESYLGISKNTILSLLLTSEIERKQKKDENRVELSKFINSYLDTGPNSKISAEAALQINRYVLGGYKKIKSKSPEPPGNFREFINTYIDLLKDYKRT